MTSSKKRGFAALTPERLREVAAMGGRSVSSQFRGFSRDPELARRAALASARSRAAKRQEAEARIQDALDHLTPKAI
jgi:hypothetical protein